MIELEVKRRAEHFERTHGLKPNKILMGRMQTMQAIREDLQKEEQEFLQVLDTKTLGGATKNTLQIKVIGGLVYVGVEEDNFFECGV